MRIHLKNYPCNEGRAPKGDPYTVNAKDVTCSKCMKPSKPIQEVTERKPKATTKAKSKVKK